MNRQKAVLAVMLALFACSLIYSFIRMPRQKRVDKLTYQSGMTAKASRPAPVGGDEATRVRLDLLDKPQGSWRAGGRNLFHPLYDATGKKPAVPLPPPPPPPDKKVDIPAIPPPQQPQAVVQTPLQREMATFTFLGFLKKDSRKTIFLTNGKEIFLVKKGDRIAGKYDVSSLTEESLTISSVQDGGDIVIPLIENKPLAAPKK